MALPISITHALIALNVAVSLVGFWALARERYRSAFLFAPYRAVRGQNFVGMVLSNFAHGDFGHLFLNMLTLYFFGPRVERELGAVPYLIVYAVSGLGGMLAVLVLRHRDPRYAALGASGAIAGVMFAIVVLAPTSSMALLFLPIAVPAPAFAVLYLVLSSFWMRRGDRVAHEAHIGGAVAGFGIAGFLFEEHFGPLVRAVTDLVG